MKDDDREDLLPEHLQHQQRGNRVLDVQRPTVNKKKFQMFKIKTQNLKFQTTRC